MDELHDPLPTISGAYLWQAYASCSCGWCDHADGDSDHEARNLAAMRLAAHLRSQA